METEISNSHPPWGYAVRRLALGALSVVLSIARFCALGILTLCRPVVVPILSWLAIGGVALWAVFVLIAGDSQFPTWRVLTMFVSCGAGVVMYHALLEWLRPESQWR